MIAPAAQVVGSAGEQGPSPNIQQADDNRPIWQRLGYSSEARYNIALTIGTVGGGLGAYHGYRRNGKVSWAIWWLICGAVVPIPTVAIALAQGFGQKKKK